MSNLNLKQKELVNKDKVPSTTTMQKNKLLYVVPMVTTYSMEKTLGGADDIHETNSGLTFS